MSIILKGNNISSSDKGIGPSEVTNIKASQNASSIILSWTNPSDVIINGTTLSTFSYVTIVRNEDHYPTSNKEGVIIYSGNAETYTDSNVVKNKKYYYRFFAYDTNKLSNNNMNMIAESTFYGLDPILKNNSWEQINTAAELGIASKIWKVGDEIDITFDKDGETHYENDIYTFQIWDFNHFDKSDGSGKAGICFGMKNLSSKTMAYGTGVYNDKRQWEDCDARRYLNDDTNKYSEYYNFPDDCKKFIKSVDLYTAKSGSKYTYSDVIKTSDKLFFPGYYELGLKSDTENLQILVNYQTVYPIFTDNNSRIKKEYNGQYDAGFYITRTPEPYSPYGTVKAISNTGIGSTTNMSSSYSDPTYVCYCFNI